MGCMEGEMIQPSEVRSHAPVSHMGKDAKGLEEVRAPRLQVPAANYPAC